MTADTAIVTPLDAALDYHARGFSIIPVDLPIPGTPPNTPGDGKTPAIAWKRYQTERASEAQIRRWFSTPSNIAIVCGAVSGIVAVDADSDEARRYLTHTLPYTPLQSRTAKGFHALYRYPGVPVSNKARIRTGAGKIAIDVRGDGGYIIAPPSRHMSGHVYQRAGDWTRPITEVPLFNPAWIAAPISRDTSSRKINSPIGDLKHSTPIVERARKYLRAIPPPLIGAGSDVATLTAACRLVRGFALDEAVAVDLLDEWAGHRPGWDRRWLAQKVTHAARYGSEAIGGLR